MAKTKSNTVVAPPLMSKEVSIEEISNGYIVSTWSGMRHKKRFAKTEKEATEMAAKMLKEK